MQQKNLRSYRIEKKKKAQNEGDPPYEEGLKDFHSDEEPENTQSQKEDMKMYLNKLNSRIDSLVEALKQAEGMITK